MVQNLRSFTVNSASTRIGVAWNALSCLNRNGGPLAYRIEYGITNFDNFRSTTGTSFIATGLRPFTTYMFQVAASNGNGSGLYSATVSRQTSLSPGNLRYVADSQLPIGLVPSHMQGWLCGMVDLPCLTVALWTVRTSQEAVICSASPTMIQDPVQWGLGTLQVGVKSLNLEVDLDASEEQVL